tara:strand:+ start:5023 stop:5658 length:636 start_codon:yes stop_codon:yes gene_type:complete
MAKLMKPFTADLTDADVSCPTYECSIRVIVGLKQLRNEFDLYDLGNETELMVAIGEVYIEFLTRQFRECNADGRPLIDEDKEARDNAFEKLISDARDDDNNLFHEECLSGYCHWWGNDGIIGAYADKIKCHEFVKLIHYVRQEYRQQYRMSGDCELPDKMDAEDVFGWVIYFATEHLDLTLEKVWVDADKYEEGAELLEWHKKLVKERQSK